MAEWWVPEALLDGCPCPAVRDTSAELHLVDQVKIELVLYEASPRFSGGWLQFFLGEWFPPIHSAKPFNNN